jgi:predicted SAM-dependent methyltransferase
VKRVLNVGGGSRHIPLPPEYAGYEQVLLDIDPLAEPDIMLDGRELGTLAGDQFDAVYCSHNLEHYYPHDVPRVLEGFLHVLKRGGFAQIKVPDMAELMQVVVSQSLELDDVLYRPPQGPSPRWM